MSAQLHVSVNVRETVAFFDLETNLRRISGLNALTGSLVGSKRPSRYPRPRVVVTCRRKNGVRRCSEKRFHVALSSTSALARAAPHVTRPRGTPAATAANRDVKRKQQHRLSALRNRTRMPRYSCARGGPS